MEEKGRKRRKPSRPRLEDHTGAKVGRWTALEYAGCLTLEGMKHRGCYYRCRCECGTERLVRAETFNRPEAEKTGLSCGCLSLERKRMNRIKLEGRRYGRWVVLEHAGNSPTTGTPVYRCRCDCGSEAVISGQSLREGTSLSCGCLKVEEFSNRIRTHGKSQSPEYKTWLQMKSRCRMSMYYIRHGIQVCERWASSFEAFVADVGIKPSPQYTLDRIDNMKGYEPGNVRWATPTQQARNKRNNRLLTCHGETKHLDEWAAQMGLSSATLYSRLRKGMSEEDAILTPNRLAAAAKGQAVRSL